MATNDIIVSKENASAQFDEHVLTIDDLNLDLSSPPPIGNTTPNTGGFTSLTASGTVTIGTGLAVRTQTTETTGSDQVLNMISLTQAEYDAIAAPVATTLYIITD